MINKDFHVEKASEMFNVELSEVTEEMRRKAKTVNFFSLYGGSVSVPFKEIFEKLK